MGFRRTVDHFDQAGFDVVAITDHPVNGDNPFRKLTDRFRLSVGGKRFKIYISHIMKETERAQDRCGMSIISGIEIKKNSYSSGESIHLLLIGIKRFVPADKFPTAKRQRGLK